MQQELGESPSEADSVLAILKTFYSKDKRPWTECVAEFNKEILESYKGVLKLDLDFENSEAEYFIIADSYLSKIDYLSLYNHLAGKQLKAVSVAKALAVKSLFLQSVSHFKEKYEWIYNPPTLPSKNSFTIGRQLRQEFQEYYGAYAEITYLIANGNALEFDRVNQMKLSDYLAIGEYLLRKRAVEAVE